MTMGRRIFEKRIWQAVAVLAVAALLLFSGAAAWHWWRTYHWGG